MCAADLPDIFLLEVEAAQQQFETNPIYWLLHEAIYCDGSECSPSRGQASDWAAQRVLAEEGVQARFDPARSLAAAPR